LCQIIVNLIGNAIKFTEKGEVVMSVTAAAAAAAETAVALHFVVRDTGIGIPLDKREKLFKAFNQVDSSMTRRFGGTGLGLAISTRLVQLMRGEIWVESEPGRGSEFHFRVRFELGKEVRPLPQPEGLRDLRVLAVDDNRINRQILEEVLRTWGLRPASADSGVAALEELRQAAAAGEPFRIAILDVMMPQMDGFTLAERIRADPPLADCALVMLSSAGQPDLARCRDLGIARFLTKPAKQSDLLDALLVALGSRGGEEAATPAPEQALASRPLHLLLAEDGVVNQKVAIGLLEARGHHVVVANNGHEALAALGGQAFDVVLMDVQMPDMDGMEATTAIRRRERQTGAHVPIVAMTAHAMKGDRERCLAAGMDGYLSKPIHAQTLYETVESLAPPSPPAAARKGPSAAGPPETIVAWEAALERVGGSKEFLQELAELFVKESPRMLAEIRASLDAGDALRLRRAGHTLKGSADCLGGTLVVAAAARLELLGRDGQLDATEVVWAALCREMDRLVPALDAFAQTGTLSPAQA
jgi:CheY-like chemotaxis protein